MNDMYSLRALPQLRIEPAYFAGPSGLFVPRRRIERSRLSLFSMILV